MRMNDKHLDVLIAKLCQDLSFRTRLIAMRRALRHVLACDEDVLQVLRAQIRALKRQLPFSKSKLASVEALLKECREHNRALVLDFGKSLRDHHQAIEQSMTYDELCDVLCVNPVHRVEAAEAEKGLFGITWIGGQFEDSATHYGSDDTGQGPITRAISAAMTDWMIKNKDKLPDPFAPGGPFYGAPVYYPQPDGTMARQSARLTVHDAQGSRVVKRKIEVKK